MCPGVEDARRTSVRVPTVSPGGFNAFYLAVLHRSFTLRAGRGSTFCLVTDAAAPTDLQLEQWNQTRLHWATVQTHVINSILRWHNLEFNISEDQTNNIRNIWRIKPVKRFRCVKTSWWRFQSQNFIDTNRKLVTVWPQTSEDGDRLLHQTERGPTWAGSLDYFGGVGTCWRGVNANFKVYFVLLGSCKRSRGGTETLHQRSSAKQASYCNLRRFILAFYHVGEILFFTNKSILQSLTTNVKSVSWYFILLLLKWREEVLTLTLLSITETGNVWIKFFLITTEKKLKFIFRSVSHNHQKTVTSF